MKESTVALPFLKGEESSYRNYINALERAGFKPVCIHDVTDDTGCAALLLPGGEDVDPQRYGEKMNGSIGCDKALDDLQFAMLDKYRALNRPVLGICRGHQLINVAFGGSLYQDIATAASHKRNKDKSENFHAISIAEESFLAPLYGTDATVNSSHHQAVRNPGAGLRAVAWHADGTVEAIEHSALPVIGVQWHPERLLDMPENIACGMAIFDELHRMLERCRK